MILDNYVNRPSYVKHSLTKALQQTGLSNPRNWSTADEQLFIKTYLEIRETYGRSPMTDAAKHASYTKKYLDNDKISGERGSFKYSVPENM